MVTGTHPEDVDLFDYVEGDLPERRRAELEVHLASCARCAEHVARVQGGRDALRGAVSLEFPAHRREAVLRELATQRARPRRFPRFGDKRLLAIPALAAGLLAVVVAIATTGGGQDNGGAAGEAAGGGRMEEMAPQDSAARARLKAEGPAPALAAALQEEGLDARVKGDHVEVRNATRADVRRALETRRLQALSDKNGRVDIVIVP
jgi:anti-sigma factor RsiW